MLDLKKEIALLEARRAGLEKAKLEALSLADKAAVDIFHVDGALQILAKLVKESEPKQSDGGN